MGVELQRRLEQLFRRLVKSCANCVRLLDYTLANPDTLTKYKTAATIAEKALKEVSGTSNTRTRLSHAAG